SPESRRNATNECTVENQAPAAKRAIDASESTVSQITAQQFLGQEFSSVNSLSVKTASHSSVVEAFRARKSGGLDSKSRLIQSPAPAPNPSDSTSNQTNGTTQNSSGYSIQLNGSPLDASGLAQS